RISGFGVRSLSVAEFRMLEQSIVAAHLLGVRSCEFGNGLVECGRLADIARECGGVAGSRMSFGERFATQPGVSRHRGSCERGWIEGGFVVSELSHEIIVAAESRIADERIRQRLHELLPLSNALTLVTNRTGSLDVRCVAGRQFLLHLQKQRILIAVA